VAGVTHEPGDVVDGYELVALLGRGAYAEVWRARDRASGTDVALKFPLAELFGDPVLFQRYQREAQIARELDHPGVLRCLDAGGRRSEPYLVLEYVEGPSLREVLSREGPLPIAQAIAWATELADALAYLHDKGIVHRDLKPENILVTPEGHLKVMDFGTAVARGVRRLTWGQLSPMLGTPDYMSPEQIKGSRADERSDVYAWGVIVYEMLTGSTPFEGDNWIAVMSGHLAGSPKPPSAVRDEVPPGLDAIVLHALRRYPEARYQSAREVRADLARIGELGADAYPRDPEPPLAAPLGAAREGRAMLKAALVIGVAFLVLAALIVAVSTLH
jgi:serine/threonine protein kinase